MAELAQQDKARPGGQSTPRREQRPVEVPAQQVATIQVYLEGPAVPRDPIQPVGTAVAKLGALCTAVCADAGREAAQKTAGWLQHSFPLPAWPC